MPLVAASATTGLTAALALGGLVALSGCDGASNFTSRILPVTNPTIIEPDNGGGTTPSGAAPTVTNVSPANGPTGGGTVVTITGTNFNASAIVRMGTSACASQTFVNATTISCTTPPRPAGTIDVIVVNPDTQVGRKDNSFSFTDNLYVCYNAICPPSNVQIGINTNYHQFDAVGGVGPYTFSVISGGGSFAGNTLTAPAAAQTITIQAMDTLGNTATADIDVLDRPQFDVATLPPAGCSPNCANFVEGRGHTIHIAAGVAPFTYTTNNPCLTLTPDTPTSQGYVLVTAGDCTNNVANGAANLTVTDAEGNSDTLALTLLPPLYIPAGNTYNITTGTCSHTISVTPAGGLPSGGNYKYLISPAGSCAGCSLNGVVQSQVLGQPSVTFNTGAATVSQDYTLQVTDYDSSANSLNVTIHVNSLPTLGSPTGNTYKHVSGGGTTSVTIDMIRSSASNYDFSRSGGTLPMGSLNRAVNVPDIQIAAEDDAAGTFSISTGNAGVAANQEHFTWADDCGKTVNLFATSHKEVGLTATAYTTLGAGEQQTYAMTNTADSYGTLTCMASIGSASNGGNSCVFTSPVVGGPTGVNLHVRDGLGFDGPALAGLTANPAITINSADERWIKEGGQFDFDRTTNTGCNGSDYWYVALGGGTISGTGNYTAIANGPETSVIRVRDDLGAEDEVLIHTEDSYTNGGRDKTNEIDKWTISEFNSSGATDNFASWGGDLSTDGDSGIQDRDGNRRPTFKARAIPGGFVYGGSGVDKRYFADDNKPIHNWFIGESWYDGNGGGGRHRSSGAMHAGAIWINPDVSGYPGEDDIGIYDVIKYTDASSNTKYALVGYHNNRGVGSPAPTKDDRDMLVIRLDGSMNQDSAFNNVGFGIYGYATMNLADKDDEAHAVAYHSGSDTLVIGGHSTDSSGNRWATLVAYSSNGVENESFFSGGVSRFRSFLGAPFWDNGVDNGAMIQSMLFVGNQLYIGGEWNGNGFIARLNGSAGGNFALDTSFNCNGTGYFSQAATVTGAGGENTVMDMQVDSTSSAIMVVGIKDANGNNAAVSKVIIGGGLNEGCTWNGWYGGNVNPTGAGAGTTPSVAIGTGFAMTEAPNGDVMIAGSPDFDATIRIERFTVGGNADVADTNYQNDNNDNIDFHNMTIGGMVFANITANSYDPKRIFLVGYGHRENSYGFSAGTSHSINFFTHYDFECYGLGETVANSSCQN